MIIREHKTYESLIISMLDKLSNINLWRKDFLIETFILFLSIRGRINFLQLARDGLYKELKLSQGSGRYAIAFDLSYISKSGKKIPGVGWYWSGCANQSPLIFLHTSIVVID